MHYAKDREKKKKKIFPFFISLYAHVSTQPPSSRAILAVDPEQRWRTTRKVTAADSWEGVPSPPRKKRTATVADVAFILLKCCEALATASIAPRRFSCFSSWTSVLCRLAFRWLSFSCHPKCTKFSSEVGAVLGEEGVPVQMCWPGSSQLDSAEIGTCISRDTYCDLKWMSRLPDARKALTGGW